MEFQGHPAYQSYEGSWEGGSFHGQGYLKLKNNESYKGNWRKGERDGLGYHVFPKGFQYTFYKGNWKADLFEGIGLLAL